MPPQGAWPQPSSWQVRLPVLSFSLGSEAEPFSGLLLVLPSGPAGGGLEDRLAEEIALMSHYLCTPHQPRLSSHLPCSALSSLVICGEHRRRVSWSGSGLVVLAGVEGLPGGDRWQGIGHRSFLGHGPGQLRQGTIWADSGAGDWPHWLWEGSWDRWSKGSDFILS